MEILNPTSRMIHLKGLWIVLKNGVEIVDWMLLEILLRMFWMSLVICFLKTKKIAKVTRENIHLEREFPMIS